jgi:GT2 family glycosyltransferase
MARMSRRPPRTDTGLQSSLELVNGSVFTGFVADPARPAQRFTVELLLDGLVIRTAYADNYIQDVAEKRIGDGCHGFAFSISQSVIENAVMAEARVANLGVAVGSSLLLSELRNEPDKTVSTSRLRWLGGLRFSGWVEGDSQNIFAFKVMVDGEQIMQIGTLGWAQADDDINKDRPARAFDFHLPERFADGCVRWLSVLKDTGEALPDGPLPFVAFPDGLAATISGFGKLDSERLRGEMYDHLVPMSLPMSQYDQWRQRFPVPGDAINSLRCAVVLVGQGSLESTLDSLESQTHADWAACAMDDEGDSTAFNAETVQAFLTEDAADSDFVVFALAGTVFEPNALQRIAGAFSDFKKAVAVYGDVDVLAADGGIWPLAFPAFDYERMLEQGYCAHLFALRRDIAEGLLASGPSNLYRLFNALFDKEEANAAKVIHVPGAIGTLPSFDRAAASAALREATALHLNRRKVNAKTTAMAAGVLPAVRVQREAPDGRTTIIIPTRDRLALLRDCLESIKPAVDKAGAEIIIVDNDSTDRATLDFLAKINKGTTRVIRVPGLFNFARLNNIAAREGQSEYLCLLNNDIKALDADWLEELLTRIAEPDVGAVGALLLWPSGVVQHGGVVLGPNFAATHAFNDRTADEPGYTDLLRVAHECSAVTAACMLTRRSDYLDAGGMDEVRLTVLFNDVDYCLRLREAGKRIVFTPHAKLIHLESASRGHDNQSDRAARFGRELQVLRSRWGQVLIDDPYYNPTLSLDAVPFSALAWPPRNINARANGPVVAVDLPSGF